MLSHLKRLVLVLLFFPWIQSCVYAPVKADHQPYANQCELVSKKLSLKEYDVEKCTGHACLVLAGVISPMSAVVSGSIVVIGNTIHWVEYNASCEANDKNFVVKL